MINYSKWLKKCLLTILIGLLAIATLVVIVDPYFHYHKPLPFLSYRLYEERYINDGISRHFDFDTIITGSSMTQNFKPSEIENLFGGKCVKEPFSGAGFKEVSENLDRTLSRNTSIKRVFWCIDYNGLIRDKDWSDYSDFPDYLYDDNIINDVSYIFNKSIFYHGVINNISMTLKGESSTSMDNYASWGADAVGLDGIFRLYSREDFSTDLPNELTDLDKETVIDNITLNIVYLVNKYPDVEFILFYPPYSICYWDSLYLSDTINRQLQAEAVADELLLNCKNVKLYNFNDKYDIITDVNNYRDKEHYLSYINSMILEWINNDEGLMTIDNYEAVINNEYIFYGNYDYNSIYQ